MKKIILMLCIVLMAVGLMACSGTGTDMEEPAGDIYFSGTIIELNGDNAIVEPYEGEAIRGSADKISINLSSSDKDFAIGNAIKVFYDGAVMESYPAQVNVLGIEKID